MKAFVFTDASLARHAGQFVWLAIDGEKANNAAAVKKLKISAYPTFYVMDPATEKIALRWVGGATVPQLHKFLDDGRVAAKGGGSELDALLANADALYGAGEDSAAAAAYLKALGTAPKSWSQYPRVMDATLYSLSASDQNEKCAELSVEAMERLGKSTSGANAALSGLGCALALPADHPKRKAWIDLFESRCVAMVADSSIAMSTDDRSGMYLELADARDDAKDAEGRKRYLAADAAMLERAAAAAHTKEQRAVFDPHRLSVYVELEQPQRAIPMLEQSERDFPDDYNPPARLAIAYNAMKQYDQALAASDRALVKAYGPRKMRLYSTRVDIYVGRGDSTSARQTLEKAIGEGQSLPEAQRPNGSIASFKKRLTAMGGSSPAAQN
jgi:tetratricopeptide (TPR) repeat protein